MSDTQTAAVAPPTPMAAIKVRLGDLGLAPENLRFKEPADDGVPQLAETILAAGVVIPPIVRAGRKGEAPFMALDGRLAWDAPSQGFWMLFGTPHVDGLPFIWSRSQWSSWQHPDVPDVLDGVFTPISLHVR